MFILGTKKGAMRLALITAIIAGSRTTLETLPPTDLMLVNKESEVIVVYLTAKKKVVTS